MHRKKIFSIGALLALIVAVAFTGYGVQRTWAADQSSEMTFHERVAQIIGVEETKLEEAMSQAREEGFVPQGRGMGQQMSMPSVLSQCTGIEVDAIREAISSSEGKTMAEVLATLGVTDLEALKSCVLESRQALLQERVDAGSLTQSEADERLAEMEERSEDMFEHEVGSGPRGEGMGAGMGRGMGRDMHNYYAN